MLGNNQESRNAREKSGEQGVRGEQGGPGEPGGSRKDENKHDRLFVVPPLLSMCSSTPKIGRGQRTVFNFGKAEQVGKLNFRYFM
jgi:hypothetical protein